MNGCVWKQPKFLLKFVIYLDGNTVCDGKLNTLACGRNKKSEDAALGFGKE